MKKLAILLLAALLLFSSCSNEPPEPEIHTSKVIRSNVYEYGSFIYFSEGSIWRYNTATGELGNACLDPECDGKCPLHGAMTRIGALEDGKLYFYSFEAFTHNINFGYQDLISGKVTVLDSLGEYEFADDLIFVSGDHFYYYAGILKDGGDAKNPEDYETRLCRIPISGGEREVLGSPSGTPQLAVDGKLVLMGAADILLYDLESGLEEAVWSFAGAGFQYLTDFSYLDGRIYALGKIPASSAEMIVNEYTGVTYAKNTFIVSLDIETGKWSKVVDDAVESFTVTDERIYYFPTVLRYLYVPANVEKNPDGISLSFFSSTLYSCRHDGSDVRAECTNEKINTCYDFTALGGKLYGQMSFYDAETHKSSSSLFCAVDLETGEVVDSHELRRR